MGPKLYIRDFPFLADPIFDDATCGARFDPTALPVSETFNNESLVAHLLHTFG